MLYQEERFGYSSWRGLNWKYEREEKGFPQGMPKTWEYSYRYNAMSERESKREWLNPGGDGTAPGYEWTYYLLGGTKEQLSVWQGTQTSEVGFCGSTGGSQIYFYPTEYLTYGGRSANITTRPNGTQEYRIADHLGSNRVTLDNTGSVVTTTDYAPFGGAIAGVPPRKGFIDKEKDQESGLGDFGVRKYDDEIGRFTSIDPLTEKMPAWSPYVYSFNSPLVLIDPNGRFPGDYYDVDGNHLGDDGIDDGKIYTVEGTSEFNIKDFQEGGKYFNNHIAFNENNGDGFSVSEISLDSDISQLARIGFAEFRGSNSTEQKVGMDITVNRVESGRYPNTLEGVIKQPWQYSSLNKGDPNKAFYENPHSKTSGSPVNQNAWVRSVSNAISVLNGTDRGISQGATLYYSPRSMIPKNSLPRWNFSILEEVQVEGIRSSHIKLFRE